MYQKHYIPVDASEGMFSTEHTINLTLSDGKLVSFLVDKTLVKFEDGKYKLMVNLVKINEKENTSLVLLPVETYETGSRWAIINN